MEQADILHVHTQKRCTIIDRGNVPSIMAAQSPLGKRSKGHLESSLVEMTADASGNKSRPAFSKPLHPRTAPRGAI